MKPKYVITWIDPDDANVPLKIEHPAAEWISRTMNAESITEKQTMDMMVGIVVPDRAVSGNTKVVLLSSIPTGHPYRNALIYDGDSVIVDMVKARDIHRDTIRIVRKIAFADNDIAVNDALLSGDADAKDVAIARRDELRDAPADPAIDAALTPEALSAVWPSGLSQE